MLKINSSVDYQTIAGIASCVDKIEELKFYVDNVTMHRWEILFASINKRPTPVS